MLKQKQFNVASSNLANFGTPLERNIKKKAAEGEPAWKAITKKPGLQVWRIEDFHIKEWSSKLYGQFFDGDSYIVLRTYKKGEAILYDVHFWLGKYTTQDEAGTAAYKTVELDDYLGDLPVQHREVQEYESHLFCTYFPNGIRLLTGGVESGFHHVKPEEYKPRLLQVKGRMRHIVVRQVNFTTESLNSGDVFILDNGLTLYQFNGSKAGASEKGKAAQLTRAIDDERGSKVKICVFEENDNDDFAKEFWKLLGGKKPIKSASEGGSDKEVKEVKKLFRFSDASGKPEFKEIEKFTKDSLDTNDVFIFDVGCEIFVWIGKKASQGERKQSLQRAQDYLNTNKRPAELPLTRLLEGAENEIFLSHFD